VRLSPQGGVRHDPAAAGICAYCGRSQLQSGFFNLLRSGPSRWSQSGRWSRVRGWHGPLRTVHGACERCSRCRRLDRWGRHSLDDVHHRVRRPRRRSTPYCAAARVAQALERQQHQQHYLRVDISPSIIRVWLVPKNDAGASAADCFQPRAVCPSTSSRLAVVSGGPYDHRVDMILHVPASNIW
jgi:hypothetical protein